MRIQLRRLPEMLRRRIELVSDESILIDLKYRLAQTQFEHLSDDRGALDNYREILFINQDHEGARLALEGMLKKKQLRGEAAAILEGIYEAREDWEKLIGALEILAVTDGQVERRVSLPIERALNGVPGLFRLRSTSLFGLSFVTLTFADGVDPMRARQQVTERLAGAALPARAKHFSALAALVRSPPPWAPAARKWRRQVASACTGGAVRTLCKPANTAANMIAEMDFE